MTAVAKFFPARCYFCRCVFTVKRFLHPYYLQCTPNLVFIDKWIPATIERQTGPVSYDTRTLGGERHRRHVDQLRTRVDTSKEKIQEKEEEDRCKEGTEGRLEEEQGTEDTEEPHGSTERKTSTDEPNRKDEHRPTLGRKRCYVARRDLKQNRFQKLSY
ncbi:hypothetical protein T07_5746 [Trichinella nelsoni]|uniref:Uncharacterized protein n=1 Tax=Trichinella nelsoni TaxID=6336 RepID=A0A0V0RSH1_9BILA|nr:hypothetical protein T07_5746 [Trichinella nelsoni]